MDFNATIDLIIKDLDEVREIIDDLKKYSGVPALQVELAKSKCKSAGEVIALLKTPDDNLLLVKDEPAQQKPYLSEEKKRPVISVRTKQITEEKKSESKTSEVISPPDKDKDKEESKSTSKKVPESTIIADRFSHLSNTFNEQLGSIKSDDDILKTKSIISLSEAIGVNDRFLFLREIFDGNKDAYNQAISRLDSTESLADARAIIMSFTGDNNENEAVIQLLDLVKRKLPSNE